MAINEREFAQAKQGADSRRKTGYAVAARFDRAAPRVLVRLNAGLEPAFPPSLIEGLAGASPDELTAIEISPAGLGLHWPKLDADLYLPGLLQGVLAAGWRRCPAPTGVEFGIKGSQPVRASTAEKAAALAPRPPERDSLPID